MEFNFINDGIDAVIIDNFYSKEQMEDIRKELAFLTKPSIMSEDKDKLEAAVDPNGKFITTKAGVWVDTVFREWRHSSLISYPMENFSKKDVREKLLEFNPLMKIFYACNVRNHLLSYYENAGYYSKHTDASVFTVLNYFHTEPKQYTGGDIVLYSDGEAKKAVVESRDNRVVIIPSCTMHEVTTIEMTSQKLSGSGRYCNSIFLTAQHLKDPHDSN